MADTIMLKGLFDRPINPDVQSGAIAALSSGYTCLDGTDPNCTSQSFTAVCDPGYYMDVNGFCVPAITFSGAPQSPPSTSSTGTDYIDNGGANVIVNNTVTLSDNTVDQLATAVNQGIQDAANATNQVVQAAEKGIQGEIKEDTDAITNGVTIAGKNLGDEVTVVTTALAASTAATVATVGSSINGLLSDVKGVLDPILTSIASVVDHINSEVQLINDTLIQPIATLYNTTIGTISTLTAAIETDLHNGISGLLAIPGQLADQLGSFDATLDRTVQQLGTTNLETVKSGIDYQGEQLPGPFSAAFASALGGKTLAGSLQTTFTNSVSLSSESLSQVSAEAIQALGPLLQSLLSSVFNTFKSSFDTAHSDWSKVESVFIPLLDGILTVFTTFTSMGALAAPLIDAAEQQARLLVPTTKLDPATVIEAMKRQFLSTEQGINEIQTYGFDSTRIQVMQDLSVFLADVNVALDWWYRGIISDVDFASNMNDHGITPEDQTAIKTGSIRLPAVGEFVRWLNYGLITADQFTANLKVLRYDDAQIQAVVDSYQDTASPQALATLDGLLNNSNIGWLSSSLNTPIPDRVTTAGQQANLRPDAVQYLWLQHWNLPSVQLFIQAYYRGIRTLTELQARFAIDNIPKELWDDLIEVNRPLIPFRTIPTLAKTGLITPAQAQTKLAAHGFSLEDQQILTASVAAKAASATATTAAQIHSLSLANAKELWAIGGIPDSEYAELLVAHGYTTDEATLQMQADKITAAVKAQKQVLSDTLAEVEAGMLTLDTAITQLQTQGFTAAQIATFQGKVAKASKSGAKHPTIAQMDKMLTAGFITMDQYESELKVQGWADPWLSALVSLVTPPATASAS